MEGGYSSLNSPVTSCLRRSGCSPVCSPQDRTIGTHRSSCVAASQQHFRPRSSIVLSGSVTILPHDCHAFHAYECPACEPVKVYPARKLRRIERNGISAGFLLFADKGRHLSSQHVIHLETDELLLWNRIGNSGRRIERIGIILIQPECSRTLFQIPGVRRAGIE